MVMSEKPVFFLTDTSDFNLLLLRDERPLNLVILHVMRAETTPPRAVNFFCPYRTWRKNEYLRRQSVESGY
jgi:hypothetical protein